MDEFIKLLEKFENLIYKVLVWIVLIPKTLLQIVLHPEWAGDYIKQELGEGGSKFDEYFSPIVLLLLVAVIPFLLWGFVPDPGIEITSPSTENPTRARTVDLTANIRFISTSTSGHITTFWRLEKESYDREGQLVYESDEDGYPIYPVVSWDKYTDDPKAINSITYNRKDSHTIQDYKNYQFTEPGTYWVVVDGSKFDSNGEQIESYKSEIQIYVPPEDSEEPVSVYTGAKSEGKVLTLANLKTQLENERTWFLVLGLLIPPLLFSLVITVFSKNLVSEGTLKETFYVQCYYFAPIAFTFWATRYAIRLFTTDVFFRYDTDGNLILFLPMILSLLWFISVQTNAFSRTKAFSKRETLNRVLSLLVVLVCMFVLGLGILFVAFNDDPDIQEYIRKSSIWLYPLVAVGLLTAYYILSILDKKKQNPPVSISTGDRFLVGGIVFIILVTVSTVYLKKPKDVPSSTQYDNKKTSIVTKMQEEYEKLKKSKFFEERFDGNLDDWTPPFMTSGDVSQVQYASLPDRGGLNVRLTPVEGQSPSAYFINELDTYTDVQVEMSVKNNDENLNTISLVCRHNDNGWYEFEVSNSGYYRIYAFDASNGSYNELVYEETSLVNTGLSENKYAAICKGNQLTFLVNDEIVKAIEDTTYNFPEGKVGIAVYSPSGQPIDVDFKSVNLKDPTSTREGMASESAPISPTLSPSSEPQSPTDQQYYVDEFDKSLDDWAPYFVTGGDKSQVDLSVENGSLNIQLSQLEGQTPSAYLINNINTYTDVQVETVVRNNDENPNTVSLVCRYGDNGWYEFEVSNAGYYKIHASDSKQGEYKELASGDTPAIQTGTSENKYSAICSGNELTLLINDTPVQTVQDTTFNFTEGKIGLSVFSPDGLPVNVSFDSVTASEPSFEPIPSGTDTAAATEAPTSTGEQYYTEEFDGTLDRWGQYFMTNGTDNQVKLTPENGRLYFQLSHKDEQFPSAYFVNDTHTYTDVQVQAVTTNNGNNSNGVDLVCQYNDRGWYEFEIANSGYYNIYAFDASNGTYNEIASGSSPAIRTGLSENLYTAICKGAELSLIINDTPVRTAQDTTFNFAEGKVGFGLSSPQGLPVDVYFDSLTVSEP